MQMMYKIFFIVAAAMVILWVIIRPKKMKLKIKRMDYSESRIIRRVDKIIFSIKLFKDIRDSYSTKLTTILGKNKYQCNTYITLYCLISIFAAVTIGILLLVFLAVWHFVILISFSVLYIFIYAGTLWIQFRMNKIYEQFPEALQIFTDEYMEYKNIKNAIDNSYNKMPEQIGRAFEKLSRELSSGRNIKESIKNMADSFEYVWGYAFAHVLLMSYEGAGNISDDLIYLGTLMSEELTIEEEVKTENATNKIIFIILNMLTLAILIINMISNDMSKFLYFFTSDGNILLIIWIVQLIAGFNILNISEKI